MSAVPTAAPEGRRPSRPPRRAQATSGAAAPSAPTAASCFPTLFMLAFLIYFLMPLVWLFIASTKSNEDLFGSFGLWFSDFSLFDNISEMFSKDDGVFATGCATRSCTPWSAPSAPRCWRPPPATGSPSSSSGARTCCSGSCSAR